MNQDFNNTNQDNYNTQGNNGIPNNQPLDNDINNTYSQPQQTNTNMYQQPLSQVNTPINNTYQQSIMQDHIQQPINSFENTNNQNYNNKHSKNKNLSLIIGVVVFLVIGCICIILVSKLLSNNGSVSDNNNSVIENDDKNTNNKVDKKGFYVVNGTQDKGKLAMATDFKSEKVNNYNYIENYNMKWVTERKLFLMSVPAIPNRTYSINSYYESEIQMNSEILDLNYSIFNQNEFKGNKSEVERLLQNIIKQTTEDPYFKLNNNTNVIEKNGVLGFAYSRKGNYTNSIAAEYFVKIDNNVSEKDYYLVGFIHFDAENYDNVKPIIAELSDTINFDIISLIDQVK